jgi:hypothetical protein
MTLLVDFATAAGATVTGGAALGVWREAHRVANEVADNSRRTERNRERSLGNRRWLRRYGPRVLPSDVYEPPHKHDPNDAEADGGNQDG